MKIFGHPLSTCTRKVLMTLAETNTPHEFVIVDFATGAHKKEQHLGRQPFGKVPTLDDDGFQMFESRAMCRYINEKAKGTLIPSDLRARARMEQWISIETSQFTAPAMKPIFHHVFQRPQPQEALDAAAAELETVLAVMDKRLGEEPYFAGKEFSLADITFMPYVAYLMVTPVKDALAKRPNVMAWWNNVSERPSWKKITAG